MIDLAPAELQALVDHHSFEGRVYTDCIASAERNPDTVAVEDLVGYQRMAEHHRERGRQLKEILAREEADQTAYEERGEIIVHRPYWLDECIAILSCYKEEAEEIVDDKLVDGITGMACGVVIGLLEYNYSEDDDELPDG